MVESNQEATTDKPVVEETSTAVDTNVKDSQEAAAALADPSAARKRRKAIIESQRKESEEAAAAQHKETENEGTGKVNKGKSSVASASDDGDSTARDDHSEAESEANATKKRKSKRTQIRYDPDVPMSKEQLAAWRREARRVRNRESAAASRQRIRNRITELETEVDEYKSKYHAALDRLKELEQLAKQNGTEGEAVSPAAEGKAATS